MAAEREIFEHCSNTFASPVEVSVADRVQTIESALSSSATAAGSVEATSHHADEEGASEIHSAADEQSSFLEDMSDNVVPIIPTQLPIWPPQT